MTDFTTSANQRRITIHKDGEKIPYAKLYIPSNKAAMADLGYSTYMLYMYFCVNADKFQIILSRTTLCREIGMGKNTYYSAFNELVEKGYLVLKEGTGTIYDFYEESILSKAKDKKNKSPKNGKSMSKKRESKSHKKVENILNIQNKPDGDSDEIPTSGKKNNADASEHRKKSIFFDI